jgi:hypothetical protein
MRTVRWPVLVGLTIALVIGAFACQPGGDLLDLKMGDCVEDPGPYVHTISALHKTDCKNGNALQVKREFQVWSNPNDHDAWPGDDFLVKTAESQCTYSSQYYVKPTEDSWDIDHRILCFGEP